MSLTSNGKTAAISETKDATKILHTNHASLDMSHLEIQFIFPQSEPPTWYRSNNSVQQPFITSTHRFGGMCGRD